MHGTRHRIKRCLLPASQCSIRWFKVQATPLVFGSERKAHRSNVCWVGPITNPLPPNRCTPLTWNSLRQGRYEAFPGVIWGGVMYWGPCGGIHTACPVGGRGAPLNAAPKARRGPSSPPAGWWLASIGRAIRAVAAIGHWLAVRRTCEGTPAIGLTEPVLLRTGHQKAYISAGVRTTSRKMSNA